MGGQVGGQKFKLNSMKDNLGGQGGQLGDRLKLWRDNWGDGETMGRRWGDGPKMH